MNITEIKCGDNYIQDSRFINGPEHHREKNPVGHWPWMSSLGYYKEDNWNHQCGATLVSSKHFLTAAHCIKNDTDQKIHVGASNFSLSKSQLHGIDVDIKGVKIHPLYNNNSSYFDIAIITSDIIKFTIGIQPICLPESSNTNVHKYDQYSVDLLGWGASSLFGNASKTLKKVPQTIFPNSYCNNTHRRYDIDAKKIQKAVPDLFPSHLICAGTGPRSQGACTGDSGGPLQFFDANKYRYEQVGVVHGSVSSCGQSPFPGIYVRLDDPAIFDFLKSATQESRFPSEESSFSSKIARQKFPSRFDEVYLRALHEIEDAEFRDRG